MSGDKAPEHQRLLNELQPYLGRFSLKDLKETSNKNQISHLSNKSAWDVRMVAMAVEADKLSAETNIPSPHFYALFRAGISNDKETLSRLSSQNVESI